jgi:spore germination protein GerM
MQSIDVAFTRSEGECSEVIVFERGTDASLEPIEAAFQVLVAGPTDGEVARGAGSIFSDESSGTVRSVTLENGLLVVDFSDFREVIPNASTSCGSTSLLAQLNTTAFQFDEVERVRYEVEASCDSFSNWLQRACMEYTRDGAEPAQP